MIPLLFHPRQVVRLKSRVVTNTHESMTYVARSRTRAVGALARVGGSVKGGEVNLETAFGFTPSREDHSGQFNRKIQDVHGFYETLHKKLVP